MSRKFCSAVFVHNPEPAWLLLTVRSHSWYKSHHPRDPTEISGWQQAIITHWGCSVTLRSGQIRSVKIWGNSFNLSASLFPNLHISKSHIPPPQGSADEKHCARCPCPGAGGGGWGGPPWGEAGAALCWTRPAPVSSSQPHCRATMAAPLGRHV